MNGYRIYIFRNPTHLLLLHQHKGIVYMCSDTLHTFIAVSYSCILTPCIPPSQYGMYVFWHPTYLHRVILIFVFWHPIYLPPVIVFTYSDTLHASITVSYRCVLTLYIVLSYICVLPPSWYHIRVFWHSTIPPSRYRIYVFCLHRGIVWRILTPYIPTLRYRIYVFWHPTYLHRVFVYMCSDTLYTSIASSYSCILTPCMPPSWYHIRVFWHSTIPPSRHRIYVFGHPTYLNLGIFVYRIYVFWHSTIPPQVRRCCIYRFWHPAHLHCVIAYMCSDTLYSSEK